MSQSQALTWVVPWSGRTPATCRGATPCRGQRSAAINHHPVVFIAASPLAEHIRLAEAVLLDAGANVTVHGITEIEAVARRDLPDIVILELSRHPAATLKIADRVRRGADERPPTFIFISSGAGAQDHETATEYGPVIDAPIHPAAFVHLVRDLHIERITAQAGATLLPDSAQPLYA